VARSTLLNKIDIAVITILVGAEVREVAAAGVPPLINTRRITTREVCPSLRKRAQDLKVRALSQTLEALPLRTFRLPQSHNPHPFNTIKRA
jgi:hypothetical protein